MAERQEEVAALMPQAEDLHAATASVGELLQVSPEVAAAVTNVGWWQFTQKARHDLQAQRDDLAQAIRQ